MVFRESRVVDEVWAGVAPRALAGEALLIVLDNFEHVPRSRAMAPKHRCTPCRTGSKASKRLADHDA